MSSKIHQLYLVFLTFCVLCFCWCILTSCHFLNVSALGSLKQKEINVFSSTVFFFYPQNPFIFLNLSAIVNHIIHSFQPDDSHRALEGNTGNAIELQHRLANFPSVPSNEYLDHIYHMCVMSHEKWGWSECLIVLKYR